MRPLLRHVLVGMVVGFVLGTLWDVVGAPMAVMATFVFCIVGMFASAGWSDWRQRRWKG